MKVELKKEGISLMLEGDTVTSQMAKAAMDAAVRVANTPVDEVAEKLKSTGRAVVDFKTGKLLQ